MRPRNLALLLILAACASAALVAAARSTARAETFVVRPLVADVPGRRRTSTRSS